MSQPLDPNQTDPNALDSPVDPPAPTWAKDDPTLPNDQAGADPTQLPDAIDVAAPGLPPIQNSTATDPLAPQASTPDIPGISPPFDVSLAPDDAAPGMPPAPGLDDPNAAIPGVPPAPGLDDPNATIPGVPPAPGLDDPNAAIPGVPPAPGLDDPNAAIPGVSPPDLNAPNEDGSPGIPPVGDATDTLPPPFAEEQPPANTGDLSGVTMGGDKKKLPIKMIVIAILALVLLISGILVVANLFSKDERDSSSTGSNSNNNTTDKPDKEVNLTYWGLWELNSTIEEVLNNFEEENPGVTITYKKQSHKDYRERLQSGISDSSGPDIFRYHNTWLPMVIDQLEPAPSGTVDMSEYFDVIEQDVKVSGEVYGVPLMFDTLALYYNPAMLESAGVSVPTTWEALRAAAQQIRVPADLDDDIQEAGVAMGTVNNVEHFPDILGLLLLQNGADPAKPDECSATNNPKLGRPDCWGQDAFLFYDVFRSESIWSSELPSSTYAFATEQVAMMFAPSWRSFEIAEINPELEFMTAPVPQLTDDKVAWATYWIEGVSKDSEEPEMAWKFLSYLSEDDTLKKLYTSQANVRMFGEIYPKTSLADELKNDDIVGAFVEQAEYAQTWYMSSFTYDNGINDQIIKYYEDAMVSVANGKRPAEVLPTVTSGVNQVFKKYGLDSK